MDSKPSDLPDVQEQEQTAQASPDTDAPLGYIEVITGNDPSTLRRMPIVRDISLLNARIAGIG